MAVTHPLGLSLRAHALALPEAVEDFPWGDQVLKVKGKIFLFVSDVEGGGLSLTAKLPHSCHLALMLPQCAPTRYGLGRSGWVTARFGPQDALPSELLHEWLVESYRAIAPKKLHAQILAWQAEDAGNDH